MRIAYDSSGKRADNEECIQQITAQKDPYEEGKAISMVDRSSKHHLTRMKTAVTHTTDESQRELAMYQTTKDLQFPHESFKNASQRQKNDLPAYQAIHMQMRTPNYKVTAQGPPQPVRPSEQRVEYSPKRVDGPIPQRCNQEETTGVQNQNLVENYQIGQDIVSLRGQDQISLQRDNTSYTNSSRGQFTRQFEESGHFNKQLGDYVLSNKFQYGYDANGGRNYASKES